MRRLVVALVIAVALGGCGAEAPEKARSKPKTYGFDPPAKPLAPGFRDKARAQLAEEWGDEYRACLRDGEYWGEGMGKHEYPGWPNVDAYMREHCRETANEILP